MVIFSWFGWLGMFLFVRFWNDSGFVYIVFDSSVWMCILLVVR